MASKVSLPNHIIFTDGPSEFTLQLQDGATGISEGASSPSTLGVTGGGGKYGDFEPNFSHIEQRTWNGGRGLEDYNTDQTRYFDGKTLWGLTEDKLFPAPLARFAKGLRTTDDNLTDSKSWRQLVGANRYISIPVGSLTADKAYLWIRRRGTPGTLTMELRADSSGDPKGTLRQTVTVTTSDITDTISLFYPFDWSSTQAITSGDHILIYGASTDLAGNCWEVAVDADTSNSRISSDGTTYAAADFSMLYRLVDADTNRKFLGFVLEGAEYAVSVEDDGSASHLFINGGRGTASSATSTTLTDTGIGWTASRWVGAWVKIVGGTGKGQKRQITANTTSQLTVATWDITPDSTSRYIIYKTPWFTEITSTSLGTVKSVAVLNRIAYFAQGESDNVRRMRDNAGTHDFADDGTNKADILYAFPDSDDGPQMWRAINGTTMEVSRANEAAWGTDLVFDTGIPVGSTDWDITNLIDYDNNIWILKEDRVFFIQNDQAISISAATEGLPGPETGQAVTTQGLFMYFSWWKSVERLYGQTLDDEGIWRGTGLPAGRDGPVSALVALLPWIFQGIDAGSGTSSVYTFQDGRYHEVFRGYAAGERVRNLFVQPHDGANPYLWISYNGELVYQEYSLTPLRETFAFEHEAVLESCVLDMGHTESYKFFKSLSASTEKLNKGGINIEVDYQAGEDVNTSAWIPAGTFYTSPTDEVEFNVGEKSRLKYRLRMNTDDANIPPIVNATVLKGYEVLPTKRLWNMRIKASSLQSSSGVASPDELYEWLWKASQKARKIKMYTVFPGVDNVYVKLEPPNTIWKFVNKAAKWTGIFQITVREM